MLEPLQSSGTWWGETLKGTTVLHDEDNDGTSTERRIITRQTQRAPQDEITHITAYNSERFIADNHTHFFHALSTAQLAPRQHGVYDTVSMASAI
jgi:hypothetical protein